MQALWNSLSALHSSQDWLSRISDNLANENTVGYASDQGSFTDAYTTAMQGNGPVNALAGRYTPPGWWGGTGIISTQNEKNFAGMPLQRTDNPLDFAIQGDGFFAVQSAGGNRLYTRAGNFTWSQQPDGSFALATTTGEAVLDTNGQPIKSQNGVTAPLTVGSDGSVTIGGRATGQKLAIYRIPLAGQELQSVGNNEFALAQGAQRVLLNQGGTANNASIAQGMLNLSNVDTVKEMTDLISAQRMFDLNTQAIQLTNRMMQDANTIRR